MFEYEPDPPIGTVQAFNYYRPGRMFVNRVVEDTKLTRPEVRTPITEWAINVLGKRVTPAERKDLPSANLPSQTNPITKRQPIVPSSKDHDT
jgi:hypothetical protein